MVLSTKLLERQGRSTVLDYTIHLVCAKYRGGAFSLTLVESSDLGDIRHVVAKRIRSPKAFVDATLSVMDWTELEIDYDVIVEEICRPLRSLDETFADAVAEFAMAERSGPTSRPGKLRA